VLIFSLSNEEIRSLSNCLANASLVGLDTEPTSFFALPLACGVDYGFRYLDGD
jgi:hypothetical protein